MALFRRLLERMAFWRWYLLEFRPIAGGEGDSDDDAADADKAADKDKNADVDKSGADKDDDDDDKVDRGDDDATKARKHERWAKREREKREKLEAELKKLRDADKSEHEKALEKAREEARNEALTEADKERRADRLELSVTRLAAKGITLGEGDDAKTVKFADADDALLRIERAIRRGDIDSEDIYDDEGKVKTDALTEELATIARDNPHLVGEGERPKPKGDPDARKGDPAKNDLESMSPEDHAKRKYGAKN